MTAPSSKNDAKFPLWWQGGLIYEVYLRSFADKNDDGIGDLPGLTSKLDYIAKLGVDAIWITPFYPSPMKDFGYDVSDYTAIDPAFGSMEDFELLLKEAHKRGLKIVMDHVWSHTSDEHPWFKASADPLHPEHEKYRDWYVWSPPEKSDPAKPPNNWRSIFAGSAWEWNAPRGSYYLHNFLKEQPDLNWHNPEVRKAIGDVAKFWLEKGVDGFRLDVCNFYTHDAELKDNPIKSLPAPGKEMTFDDQCNIHNISQPENLVYLDELRKVFAGYPAALALGELAAIDGDLRVVDKHLIPGKRLDTGYADFLIYPDYPEAATIEKLLTGVAKHLPEKELCWVLGTHDFHRVASRWRTPDPTLQKDMIIQTMAFLLSVPGLSSIYQGEELGLPDGAITFEQMQDPQGINFADLEMSRDGCRVPFPWTEQGPSLGFNTSGKSWLPADDRYRAMAADAQAGDAGSVLSLTQKMIKLRQETPAWRQGKLTDIFRSNTILKFERTTPEGRMMFLFNFSAKAAECDDTFNAGKGTVLCEQGFSARHKKLHLAPYGFSAIKL